MNAKSAQATRGTVLIAGATGFVGEQLRQAVRDSGYTVRLLVRSQEDERRFRDAGYETTLGDILDPQALYTGMEGVDAVINLVAIIKESGDATFERINYQGTTHLVDAARQAGISRFVQMSAIGAGNLPDFPYHFTKWRAENYVKDRVPSWTILRPSIVFGPTSEGHAQFVSQLADLVRGAPVIPVAGDGSARFQPIHTADVADAFATVLGDASSHGKIYAIGGPEVLTYRDILDEVAATLDISKPKINVPIPLIRFGVGLINPLPLIEPPVTREQLSMLQIDNVPEVNSTSDLIGREPISFTGGGLDFLRENQNQKRG